MARARDPQRLYSGRPADTAVLSISMNRIYAEKLRAWSGGPGTRRLGKFIEQLARDYEVRREERQRVQERIMAVIDGDDEAPQDA